MDELSRGTGEQLYLALRFGLIEEFAGQAEPLPVVMDDILVNFDVERARRGLPTFQLGVGINSGDVFTGYIGSPKRMDFTVIGDHVNIASRLCSVAAGGKVIVGEPTYQAVKNLVEVRSAGTPVLKGKTEQVNAYEIVRFKDVIPATMNA